MTKRLFVYSLLLALGVLVGIALFGCSLPQQPVVPPVTSDAPATLPQKIEADAKVVSSGGTVLKDVGVLVQAVKDRIRIGKKKAIDTNAPEYTDGGNAERKTNADLVDVKPSKWQMAAYGFVIVVCGALILWFTFDWLRRKF